MKLSQSYKLIRSSLPHSRHFLRGLSLDDMPFPIQRSFEILGIDDEEKDHLTVDEVISKIYKHKNKLMEEVARTPDELVKDLNQFVSEYHDE